LHASVASKKAALEIISETACQFLNNHTTYEIFDKFFARERLGSTAIGHGIALPHARLENNHNTTGVFLSLKEPIEYDAPDNQPVHLLFALIVPQNSTQEHLNILAALAKTFRDDTMRDTILAAENSQQVYDLFSQITV